MALEKIMAREKLYLDKPLSCETLAKRLNVTKHHLSQALNDKLHQPYHDYINSRRNHAARLLSDPSNYHLTVAAIAFDSGFTSISTSNDLFRKKFETMPTGQRSNNQKKLTG